MSATTGAPALTTLQRKAVRRELREERKSAVVYAYGTLDTDYVPRRERRAPAPEPITAAPRANRSDAAPARTERARRIRAQRRAVKFARIEARP